MASTPPVYLFRGTTMGWPGNHAARTVPLTYTTLDPIVAFQFALECRGYGNAVVIIGERGAFSEIAPGPYDRYYQRLECSVTLAIPPAEFAAAASRVISLDDCRRALVELGFKDLPAGIFGLERLRESLAATDEHGERLNEEQVRRFIEMTLGVQP